LTFLTMGVGGDLKGKRLLSEGAKEEKEMKISSKTG